MGSAEFANEWVSIEKVPAKAAHKALPNQYSCFSCRTTFAIKLQWIQVIVYNTCLLLPPNLQILSRYKGVVWTQTVCAWMFARCFSGLWLWQWQWAMLWLDGALAMWYIETATRVVIAAPYPGICESPGSDYCVHICTHLWRRIISAMG